VCKGAWNFFVYVQKQVEAAYNMRAGATEAVAEPTLEELLQGVEGIPVEGE
jgi:hypothetical protein